MRASATHFLPSALPLALSTVHGCAPLVPLEERVSVFSPRGQGTGGRLLTPPYFPQSSGEVGHPHHSAPKEAYKRNRAWDQHLEPPIA